MEYLPSYTNELYHHGILGMKWGVRRYQNKDGSLTPAGKVHYGKHTEYIDAGSEFRRFGAYNEKPDMNNSLYVSANDRDFEQYSREVKELPSILKSEDFGKMSIATFKADKKLKIATGKNVAEYILNEHGSKPYYETGKTYLQKYNESSNGKERMKLIYDLRGGPGTKLLETEEGNTQQRRDEYFKNYSKMKDNFKNQGYDAIIDPEDYNNTNKYYDKPLIILDPKNSISEIGRKKIESLSSFEEDIWFDDYSNPDKYNKYLSDSKKDLEKRYKSY